jgi:peptide/nickel transport system substrate-binding protein
MARTASYFFLVALMLLAGCTSGGQRNKNVFYWNIAAGFSSADPAYARTQSNTWVAHQLFNTLVELDDSLNLKPSLAKSWTISQDGLDYTFILRNDVYFHDDSLFAGGKGRKMTANDVVYSFNRLIDPATASTGSWIFIDKVSVDSLSHKGSFKALNDTTLQIHLIKPFRPFLQLLSLQYCGIVPQEVVAHYGKDFRLHPVGTGPFMMKYYYEGEKIVLHKNPHYFEKDKDGSPLSHLDAVVISFAPSKQNEFFSFVKGDLSFLSGLDQSFKDELLTKDGRLQGKYKDKFQFSLNPFLNTEYLGILVDKAKNKGPLTDVKVRQAINYAIDRAKMIRYLRNNAGAPGEYGFVPPYLMKGVPRKTYYRYDLAKAKQLLHEAGYTEANMPAVTLATTDNYLDLAIYVQKQLQDIGIKVNILNMPGASLSEMKTKSQTEFFRASWVADYADPENYLSIFYSKNWAPNGPNYFHYKNEEFDQLYESVLTEADDAKRMTMYSKMQDILMQDAPVVVLYYDKVVWLKQNNVEGLEPNPINMISLKRVRLK